VVEDDRVNQSIVCAMLRNAGYRTSTADDGAQALALLSCNDYDMVLMDWQMPDMDGLEVTRRLRAGAAGRHGKAVPIVALTANAFVEDRTACLAAGMNDFLTKPVLAASLEATVGRWTQHVRRTAAPPSVFGVLHPSP
jgi:CheY-like chemotaxis protein